MILSPTTFWARVRFWILFSLLAILLGAGIASAFTDIDPNNSSQEVYRHLSDIGVMSSYDDGSFQPDKLLSRAEGLVIALRAGGIWPEEASETQYFEDVSPDIWYANFVEEALRRNIITTEYPFFYPQQAISKAEFLRWILMSTNTNIEEYREGIDVAADIAYDSPYAPEFRYAAKFNIVYSDSDDKFYPTEVITRGVAAHILYRHLRVIHADDKTLQTIEMRAEIESFLEYVKDKENDKAQLALINVQKIVDRMMRSRGDEDDVVAAFALSQSMDHFNTAMTAYQYDRYLKTFEYLLLASKQARRAEVKGNDLGEFAKEFQEIISTTIIEITE